MEAVEEDDEDRMRAFLDRNVPRRTAAVVIGGGSAEPGVVEPSEMPVRTSGAASSSSSGGAQPSPMASMRGAQERTFVWFSASIGRHPRTTTSKESQM